MSNVEDKSNDMLINEKEATPNAENISTPSKTFATKLSIVGLILSVFFGIGIIFSAIGILSSVVNRTNKNYPKNNELILGVGGFILSLVFAVMSLICVQLLLA